MSLLTQLKAAAPKWHNMIHGLFIIGIMVLCIACMVEFKHSPKVVALGIFGMVCAFVNVFSVWQTNGTINSKNRLKASLTNSRDENLTYLKQNSELMGDLQKCATAVDTLHENLNESLVGQQFYKTQFLESKNLFTAIAKSMSENLNKANRQLDIVSKQHKLLEQVDIEKSAEIDRLKKTIQDLHDNQQGALK